MERKFIKKVILKKKYWSRKDLIDFYTTATNMAFDNKQMVGEKGDYYITLEQLNGILLDKINV